MGAEITVRDIYHNIGEFFRSQGAERVFLLSSRVSGGGQENPAGAGRKARPGQPDAEAAADSPSCPGQPDAEAADSPSRPNQPHPGMFLEIAVEGGCPCVPEERLKQQWPEIDLKVTYLGEGTLSREEAAEIEEDGIKI